MGLKDIKGFHKFIKNNCVGRNNRMLTELVNTKFKMNLTVKQIKSYKQRHKLSSGLRNQNVKGMVPSNAIKKGQHLGKATEFKPGAKPINELPIGTEVLRTDGYVWVKVNDNPGPHNIAKRWMSRSNLVWKKTYGDVPRGMNILHLDGDRTNDDITNLEIVDKKLIPIMVKLNLISSNSEVTRTNISIAKLVSKTSEKKKERGSTNVKQKRS